MRIAAYAAAFALVGLTAGAALAQPAKTADTSAGPAYVNAKGMTLYTFDKDTKDKSNCNGGCATNWPPFAAKASDKASGEWTLVTRDDGSHQWAYEGKPLYTWANDKKAGDAGGGKVPGWHVAAP
jgi:predicted lipoprotein with Yx(FWY)xxD motif